MADLKQIAELFNVKQKSLKGFPKCEAYYQFTEECHIKESGLEYKVLQSNGIRFYFVRKDLFDEWWPVKSGPLEAHLKKVWSGAALRQRP